MLLNPIFIVFAKSFFSFVAHAFLLVLSMTINTILKLLLFCFAYSTLSKKNLTPGKFKMLFYYFN